MQHVRTRIVSKNGNEFWIEGVLVPSMGANGRYIIVRIDGANHMADYEHDELDGAGITRTYVVPDRR